MEKVPAGQPSQVTVRCIKACRAVRARGAKGYTWELVELADRAKGALLGERRRKRSGDAGSAAGRILGVVHGRSIESLATLDRGRLEGVGNANLSRITEGLERPLGT